MDLGLDMSLTQSEVVSLLAGVTLNHLPVVATFRSTFWITDALARPKIH